MPLGNISKVALLCSRTCKTGHHSISSSFYKNQVFSQRDVKILLDAEQRHKNQLNFSHFMQFATLHKGFHSFPPISIFYLVHCAIHVRRSTSEIVTL